MRPILGTSQGKKRGGNRPLIQDHFLNDFQPFDHPSPVIGPDPHLAQPGINLRPIEANQAAHRRDSPAVPAANRRLQDDFVFRPQLEILAFFDVDRDPEGCGRVVNLARRAFAP
jgi:hypothetical protein